MKMWWAGATLAGLGLLWLSFDWIARTVFPLSWGGPNIGGGGLILLALLMIVAGLVLSLVALPSLRASQPRRSIVLGPVAVVAVLLLVVIAVRVALPGDIGADGRSAGINGQVGISVDATGAPVLLLELCRGQVDTVTIVGPNRGNVANEMFAELHAPSPVTATLEIAPLTPPSGWTGAPASLPVASQTLLIASAQGKQSELRQVDFNARELAELKAAGPDTVQYSTYDPASEEGFVHLRTTRAEFHALACN
jgi:hypothetical protein